MRRLIVAAIVFLGAAVSLRSQSAQSSAAALFNQEVRPILEQQCQSCHGGAAKQSGLDITSREKLLRGGDHGPAVIPGKPEESLLYLYVKHERQPGMPFGGKKLSDEQIARIAEWIRTGALFDAPLKTGAPAPKRAVTDHWAFRPPGRPSVPVVKNAKWVRNPIDAFLAADQEKKGLQPLPEADKYTLLRRVYLDLAGIPPTREQLHAFLSDRSDNAYEKVVDQLLASPQYGERWGRHWMDIWRYSDWWGLGQEVRNSQKHIWHWRDWIVESLNADKGYDQMIREMLAADELYPSDLGRLRATGLLARPYFLFNRTTWLDEVVEHTSKAFLGLTLNCTKCHD